MRHIRTNHNPLTISDILLKNGTTSLEDFYPLTKVKTASDKEKLLSQGYNPGYTVSEWPYKLPVDKIYYSKHLIPSTYYYDPDNEAIPIALCLNIYGTERIPIIPDSDQFCEYLLDFAASLQNPDKDKIFSYLYNQDDGIRSQLLAEYIRRSSPSPELFDLFQMLYTVTDYNAGEYGAELLQKLASGRSDEQIQKIHNALADYPEELIVYRGEAEVTILALQYPDSGKLSTDVLDVDTGIDWLVYPARYSQQCQAQSHFVVRSRLDIVENTEIMVGPNQSFYRGTLRPDCRPFRAGIFILSMDGVSGLEEGAKAIFPNVAVQRCIVHLIRNSIKYVPNKDYKRFTAQLKKVYGAASLKAAESELERFKQAWSQYPGAVDVWIRNWEHVAQLFQYGSAVRKILYTTNAVESVNSSFRKVTKKGAFPNENALLKLLYLRITELYRKWNGRPLNNWALVRNQLDMDEKLQQRIRKYENGGF